MIAGDVEALAAEAKSALEEVASADAARVQASLLERRRDRGPDRTGAAALRASTVDLPGAEPDAAMHFSNATLVRRSATLAAIEAGIGPRGELADRAARARRPPG